MRSPHQHRVHQDARRRIGRSDTHSLQKPETNAISSLHRDSLLPISHRQCFTAAHAIAIRRARSSPISKLWRRIVMFSFRVNIVAATLSRVHDNLPEVCRLQYYNHSIWLCICLSVIDESLHDIICHHVLHKVVSKRCILPGFYT